MSQPGSDTDQRIHVLIWEWLPARRDRGRVTLPTVAATALNLPTTEVIAAYAHMERGYHIVRDPGGWHRGIPLPKEPDPC